MIHDTCVKCTKSNHSDFKLGGTYRVGEFGYVLQWCINDDFNIYKKWDDESSGLIASFIEVRIK